jgi:hypothetical protein
MHLPPAELGIQNRGNAGAEGPFVSRPVRLCLLKEAHIRKANEFDCQFIEHIA